MTAAPYFSVVIPTYNRASLIADAVRSVMAQTFEDFEVIVVDNGSTDETESVVTQLADERVVYVRQPGSGSPASPRNNGLGRARGAWVAFLDSDDLWLPGKLRAVADAAAGKDCELICHWQAIQDFSGQLRQIVRTDPSGPHTYAGLLLSENTLVTSSVAVNRCFLDREQLRFSEADEYTAVEDFDLWLRMLHRGARMRFIRQVLGFNREGNTQLGSSELIFQNLEHLFHDHVFELQTFGDAKERMFKRLLAGVRMRRAMTCRRQRKPGAALMELARAVRLDPVEPLRYAGYRIKRRMEWRAILKQCPQTGTDADLSIPCPSERGC